MPGTDLAYGEAGILVPFVLCVCPDRLFRQRQTGSTAPTLMLIGRVARAVPAFFDSTHASYCRSLAGLYVEGSQVVQVANNNNNNGPVGAQYNGRPGTLRGTDVALWYQPTRVLDTDVAYGATPYAGY
eukprot:641357-Rhodomonas_salina.1